MNPLQLHNKTLLEEIKTKQSTSKGTIYHLQDHENNMMETYDADGFLIASRRLRPDEKQGNVFQLSKTAN